MFTITNIMNCINSKAKYQSLFISSHSKQALCSIGRIQFFSRLQFKRSHSLHLIPLLLPGYYGDGDDGQSSAPYGRPEVPADHMSNIDLMLFIVVKHASSLSSEKSNLYLQDIDQSASILHCYSVQITTRQFITIQKLSTILVYIFAILQKHIFNALYYFHVPPHSSSLLGDGSYQLAPGSSQRHLQLCHQGVNQV